MDVTTYSKYKIIVDHYMKSIPNVQIIIDNNQLKILDKDVIKPISGIYYVAINRLNEIFKIIESNENTISKVLFSNTECNFGSLYTTSSLIIISTLLQQLQNENQSLKDRITKLEKTK